MVSLMPGTPVRYHVEVDTGNGWEIAHNISVRSVAESLTRSYGEHFPARMLETCTRCGHIHGESGCVADQWEDAYLNLPSYAADDETGLMPDPKPAERNFCPECGFNVPGWFQLCPVCLDNGQYVNLDEYVASVNAQPAGIDLVTELARALGLEW